MPSTSSSSIFTTQSHRAVRRFARASEGRIDAIGGRGKLGESHLLRRGTGLRTAGSCSLSSNFVVETMGLEPTTPCLQSRCSSQLSYTPKTAQRCSSLALTSDFAFRLLLSSCRCVSCRVAVGGGKSGGSEPPWGKSGGKFHRRRSHRTTSVWRARELAWPLGRRTHGCLVPAFGDTGAVSWGRGLCGGPPLATRCRQRTLGERRHHALWSARSEPLRAAVESGSPPTSCMGGLRGR